MRNVPKCKYISANAINVYDILNHDKLVITQAALNIVTSKALGTTSSVEEVANGDQ
jgi:ribosomal protein L4